MGHGFTAQYFTRPPVGSGSPLTTKGDIHGFDTADVRLAVGADDEVLIADSAAGLGIKWGPAGATHTHTKLVDDELDDRIVVETNGDITLYKDDGTTVSLLWDESNDWWAFSTRVRIVAPTTALDIVGTDAGSNHIQYLHDGTNISGTIGHADAAADDFYFRSLRGDVRIYAEDSEDDLGARIFLEVDDSAGVRRTRIVIDGFTGDIQFRKDDGVTHSLLWDESADRWSMSTTLIVNGTDVTIAPASGSGRLNLAFDGLNVAQYHVLNANTAAITVVTPGVTELQLRAASSGVNRGLFTVQLDDAGGVLRTRLRINNTEDDIEFLKGDGSTVSLRWDESDDQWELSTTLVITTDPVAAAYVGADTQLYMTWNHDGANLSGIIGHLAPGLDTFRIASNRGNLELYAVDSELNLGANLEMRVDDATGTLRLRQHFVGSSGDIEFRKEDGATFSLLWDESDDQWEFGADLDMGGFTLQNVALINGPAATDFALTTDGKLSLVSSPSGADGHLTIRISDPGDVDRIRMEFVNEDIIFSKVDGATASLRWDESDDRWEFGTVVTFDDNLLLSTGGRIITTDVDLRLQAKNSGAAAQDIDFFADDSGGIERQRFQITGLGDIHFFKVDGSTISLLWDESDDRWEFNTDIRIQGAGGVLDILPTTGLSILNMGWDGVAAGGLRTLGTGQVAVDAFSSSGNPILRLRAYSTGANRGILILQADDDTGTLRDRVAFNQSDGDIAFYKNDGPTTISLLWDESDDRWEFNTPVLIDQPSTTGAAPVLTLDQADIDEDFFKFIGISDTNVDRALVDAANFTTPGAIVGWLKVNVQDDQGTDPIVDGDYYVPFYAAPTA